jgi:hypothetical protein
MQMAKCYTTAEHIKILQSNQVVFFATVYYLRNNESALKQHFTKPSLQELQYKHSLGHNS